MKKLYLLLIFVIQLAFGQNSELLNTDWQVTKITGEVFPDQYPPPMPYTQVTHFDVNVPQLNVSFFNSVSANLTFSGDNMFTLSNKACTLGSYMADSGQVNQFFGLLCSFFSNDSNYYYTIQNNGNERVLIIGNAIFESIYFKSVNLGTQENRVSQFLVAPNPVSDILKIKNLKPNSTLELVDNSGKLVRSITGNSSEESEMNIKNLSSGIYYLKINGQDVQKIIKN